MVLNKIEGDTSLYLVDPVKRVTCLTGALCPELFYICLIYILLFFYIDKRQAAYYI